MRRVALLGCVVLAAGCSARTESGSTRAPQAAPRSPPPAAVTASSAPAAGPLEASQRDPFRRELELPRPPKPGGIPIQGVRKLDAFGLDELQLIAVVGGQRPMAMLRTPAGEGVLVKRGDLIGKGAARVKMILPDRVVVEVRSSAADRPQESERVIRLHPG